MGDKAMGTHTIAGWDGVVWRVVVIRLRSASISYYRHESDRSTHESTSQMSELAGRVVNREKCQVHLEKRRTVKDSIQQ